MRLLESGYPCVVIEAKGAVDRAVVVVPAHDEASLLEGCLRSVLTAVMFVPVPTQVVVVLDACDDGSAAVVKEFCVDVDAITIDVHNVGAARAVGFAYARSIVNAVGSRIWYATTDADSRVGPDWLLRQIAADADVVLGVVHVHEWRHHSPAVALRCVICVATGPRGRVITMSMVRTWGFALARIGASEALLRWRRARTWSWSSDSNAPGMLLAAIPACRWRPRIGKSRAPRRVLLITSESCRPRDSFRSVATCYERGHGAAPAR